MTNFSRINSLLHFLEEDPKDTFVMFALAKEYEKQKLLKKALDVYHQLRDIDYKYIGLYYHLGKLHEELGSKSEALKVYTEGISIAKKIADFHSLSELHTAKMNLEIENS